MVGLQAATATGEVRMQRTVAAGRRVLVKFATDLERVTFRA